MFGDDVSPERVEQMIKSESEPAVGGAEVELTPFFASVHSYVGLAEQVSLAQLRELLNTYFDACVTEIQAEGGTLDKFVGDAIVAMFGAPVRMQDHALHACVAAVKCQERVGELRERWRREGDRWPERARQLRVRIGMHTGVAIVGNMGTATRFNYTMIGDNVNLAARMESGAKSWGVWTLCTDTTRQACDRAEIGRVGFRSLGRIIVKGRANLVELFEPIGLRGNVSDQQHECIAVFDAGLARWQQRDWVGAISSFEQSARLERDQVGASPGIKANPSTIYLEMARSYLAKSGRGAVGGVSEPADRRF